MLATQPRAPGSLRPRPRELVVSPRTGAPNRFGGLSYWPHAFALPVHLTSSAQRRRFQHPEIAKVPSAIPDLGKTMSYPSIQEAAPTGTTTRRPELRSEPLYSCPKLVRMRPASAPGAVFRLSAVHNVSANGIGLAVTAPIPTDTILE